jgi:hypothetical protein
MIAGCIIQVVVLIVAIIAKLYYKNQLSQTTNINNSYIYIDDK